MKFEPRPRAVLDIETYPNYFLVCVRDVTKRKFFGTAMFEGQALDKRALFGVLKKYTIITFNGRNYDLPMLMYALSGASCAQLKVANDLIIERGVKPWEFLDRFNLAIPDYVDHIDLIEPAPGVMTGLKIYGGRIHEQRMQDLPYPPSHIVQPDERVVIFNYCGNDLSTTINLYFAILKQLELREKMSIRYGMDLRSKSDAQIGEAVIRQAVEKSKGRKIYATKYPNGFSFKYKAPSFIRFKTQKMRDVLALVESVDFIVDKSKKKGKKSDKQVVNMPEELKKLVIEIGAGRYRMGIGGLHSSEKSTFHVADEENGLCDIDAKSFYPYLILEQGIFPEEMGPAFIPVYSQIVETRVKAKDSGDEVTADSGKIIINGSFGKLGNMYSVLFAPELLIQTTLTGQLALLMVIESLELQDIPVVSANTDGMVVKYPRHLERAMRKEVEAFEMFTGMQMEYTHYKGIYARDVNNYLAVYEKPKKNKDGSLSYAKTKGAYAPTGLMKNPMGNICTKAAVDFIVHGTPIERTIGDCTDIREFVFIKKVQGGGVQGGTQIREHVLNPKTGKTTLKGVGVEGGTYLGKAVRFYYSDWSPGPIMYKTSGNKVGESTGCLALMNLPEELPDDLAYERYIARASGIIAAVGIGNAEIFDMEWDEPDDDSYGN